MTQPPPAWFPDPEQPGQLRYWDGAQWTTHVAPFPVAPQPGSPQPGSPQPGSPQPGSPQPGSPQPAALPPDSAQAPAKRGGLPVWAIVAICGGVMVLVLGILAAMAIPAYLNQQHKAADAAAQASVNRLAIAIAEYGVDYGGESPIVTAPPGSTIVQVAAPDGMVVKVTQLDDGVSLGGFTTYNDGNWCVWVIGDADPWYWSSSGGLATGSCP